MNHLPRTVGRARVPTPAPEPLLRARLSLWRQLDQVRLMALRALTSARRAHPGGDDDQLLLDVERLARALVGILITHSPHGTSRYCPACSTDDVLCPWPCPTWHIAHRELHSPPDIPAAAEAPDGRPSWFGDPS